ncbi:MAG: IclR family transcriptional regulator, partial [Mycobacterium sp.]|nr:IclR family transcriptional regulator [Mycobacterium sp.]
DELKRQTGSSYCEMTALNPDDLPRIAAALADFDELEVDTEATTVAVPAPRGVATLTEVSRRMDDIGVELIDISLRRPSLDEVFLHLTTRVATK